MPQTPVLLLNYKEYLTTPLYWPLSIFCLLEHFCGEILLPYPSKANYYCFHVKNMFIAQNLATHPGPCLVARAKIQIHLLISEGQTKEKMA